VSYREQLSKRRPPLRRGRVHVEHVQKRLYDESSGRQLEKRRGQSRGSPSQFRHGRETKLGRRIQGHVRGGNSSKEVVALRRQPSASPYESRRGTHQLGRVACRNAGEHRRHSILAVAIAPDRQACADE
jgi:hypothetical protein